ncbi:MAG: hypothetical protein WA666_11900 [Nitrospirota bacterium]
MKKYLVSLLIVGAVLLAGSKAADAHVRFSFGFAVAPPAFGYYNPYAYNYPYPAPYPYYYPRYSYPYGYYPRPYYRRYYNPWRGRYWRHDRDNDDYYYRR